MLEERGAPEAGESLSRAERLRRRSDFLRCYRRGRRRHGSLSILYSSPNEERHARLGITVSRKVGHAVVRHRVKRRIREIYRRWSGRRGLPPVDLVVHVKPEAASASFEELRRELHGHFGVVHRGVRRAC